MATPATFDPIGFIFEYLRDQRFRLAFEWEDADHVRREATIAFGDETSGSALRRAEEVDRARAAAEERVLEARRAIAAARRAGQKKAEMEAREQVAVARAMARRLAAEAQAWRAAAGELELGAALGRSGELAEAAAAAAKARDFATARARAEEACAIERGILGVSIWEPLVAAIDAIVAIREGALAPGDFSALAMPDGTAIHLREDLARDPLAVAALHQAMMDGCPVCRGEREANGQEAVVFEAKDLEKKAKEILRAWS